MTSALTNRQPQTPSMQLLRPLLEGKPVVLQMQDNRMLRRKRAPHPLLFIAPISLYGGAGRQLVISLQAHGCEIVDVYPEIGSMVFTRLGMGARLSKALSRSLNDIYRL